MSTKWHAAFWVMLCFGLLSACAPAAAPVNTAATSAPAAVAGPSSASVGNISGRLLQLKQGSTQPFKDAPLYLGGLVKSDKGVESMGSMSRQTAPKTTADDQGNFVFKDVPPGRYTLWLDTPRGAIMLNDPKSGSNFIIDLQGGQVKSLGELSYDLPFSP